MKTAVCVMTVIMPKPITHAKAFNFLIVWNLGYSNYITSVQSRICTHIDPGGTLPFPTLLIHKACAGKSNFVVQLHKDRFHSSYTKQLRVLNAEVSSTSIFSPNNLSAYTESELISFGHLNKLQIRFFVTYPYQFSKFNYLILPNHGQPALLSEDVLNSFRTFSMIISGSQSRTYTPHPLTSRKFGSMNIPLIHKTIWGHLIFSRTQ